MAKIATIASLVSGLLALTVSAGSCGSSDSTGPRDDPNGEPPPPSAGQMSFEREFSTYLGGSGEEEIREPLLLDDGRLLFGSRTKSSDMPTTPGALQASFGGGAGDSYLAVMRPDGSGLDAATYFGGSRMERPPYGIAVAADGDVVFSSGTTSPDIPSTFGAYRESLHSPTPEPGGGYVCRASADLRRLRWCTYTGGGWPRGGLAIGPDGSIWVAGRATGENFAATSDAVQRESRGEDDAFLLQLNGTGTRALYATRLGGTGSQIGEVALSVAISDDRSVFAQGISRSLDFPTTESSAQPSSTGTGDAFFVRLDPSGQLVYSTLLGGSGGDACEHRSVLLSDGSVLCGGTTDSSDFPGGEGVTGRSEGFVAKLSPGGEDFPLVRMLGGSGFDHTLGPKTDSEGRIYLFGRTGSRDLPVTENALQTAFSGGEEDGFLVVLSPDAKDVLYGTYVGGSGEEIVRGVAIGPAGELYLVGRTNSNDFPVTAGALQPDRGGDFDGFIMKLVPRAG